MRATTPDRGLKTVPANVKQRTPSTNKIHIAGICGVFMAGIARLAREMGFQVAGSDQATYPPMNRQLQEAGIRVQSGYEVQNIDRQCSLLVIGNALSRGMPFIEDALKMRIPVMSGPQWLATHVLKKRRVVAVAGTHGKTTTASMIAWILQHCGKEPGFLIGGVPANFGVNARSGSGRYFVLEADEYDSAYFDKRPKFLHFHPDILVLNNLEYDHADIFADLAALEQQFAYLLRNVPGDGVVIARAQNAALKRAIAKGIWTKCVHFGYSSEHASWSVETDGDERVFEYDGAVYRQPLVKLCGEHNVLNATAAIAAAHYAGITVEESLSALENFRGVARRLEVVSRGRGITIYDDFAHHPTAIKASIQAVRSVHHRGRVLAVFEPRSNTMKAGLHNKALPAAFAAADRIYCHCPAAIGFSLEKVFPQTENNFHCFTDTKSLFDAVTSDARENDCILVMSNGNFENLAAVLAAFYA